MLSLKASVDSTFLSLRLELPELLFEVLLQVCLSTVYNSLVKIVWIKYFSHQQFDYVPLYL